jgi:hypothetical protein
MKEGNEKLKIFSGLDVCGKWLSNPPNPPLLKGGKGGFSWFARALWEWRIGL